MNLVRAGACLRTGGAVEHRWGQRVPIDTRVRFISRPSAIGSGRFRDVSVSGAFVVTNLQLPVLAPVNLEVQLDRGSVRETLEIAACVVRSEPRGIALEWRDLAPPAIVALVTEALGERAAPAAPSLTHSIDPQSRAG